MNAETKALTDTLPRRIPGIWKSCYPRHIVPPQGYTNPKYYSMSLSACALMWERSELSMLPHITCALTSLFQACMAVPTYFIREEFAHAVANTRLPADFRLSELRWPLDAMVFVLPDDFVWQYFQAYTPFISLCRCPQGRYPTAEQVAHTRKNHWEINKIGPIQNEVDRMLIHFPYYFRHEVPCDYSGSWPLKLDLSTVLDADFIDATGYEKRLHRVNMDEPADAPSPAQEKELRDKMQVFAVKLMLAFTARPRLIRNGSLERKAKVRQGRVVQNELWSPNLVGWDYVVQRGNGTSQDTHASPRMHYRVGHFTQQFIGKRNDPDFVPTTALPRKAADGTIDWENIEPKVQEAFKRNHELRWLEPVLVGTPENP